MFCLMLSISELPLNVIFLSFKTELKRNKLHFFSAISELNWDFWVRRIEIDLATWWQQKVRIDYEEILLCSKLLWNKSPITYPHWNKMFSHVKPISSIQTMFVDNARRSLFRQLEQFWSRAAHTKKRILGVHVSWHQTTNTLQVAGVGEKERCPSFIF